MGGESPISFLAIDAYARRYGITDIEFETFHALVGSMDDEYLKLVAEKAKEDEDRRKTREVDGNSTPVA